MAISRNLVGRESVAWVQIPPSPPRNGCPLIVGGSFSSILTMEGKYGTLIYQRK